MKNYNFIKISNNNNPSQDFFIDITTMKSVTLRMQILKSQCLKHKNTDYSYYKIDNCDFDTYTEARKHATDIYNSQFLKMQGNDLNKNKKIISFN